ncbi:MAG: DUF6036 family nucleotidyltransferase [Elusimicrobiota bacterium]
MNRSGARELRAFLQDIDTLLGRGRPQSKITLFIFGGAAAVIAYGSRRGTIDIDAYLEDGVMRRKLAEWAGEASELARKHGIHIHGANTSLMLIEDPDWKGRCLEIFKGGLKHMRIKALGKEDLILSKLSRYNDRDREDIKFLAENHEIDPKKLIAYYKSARPYYIGRLKTLDQTFNIILQEHFRHRPIDFGKGS